MTLLPASLSTARWAISTVFLLNGAGIGLWAAHVPAVQARTGIDTGTLSLVLLTIAAGGLLLAPPVLGYIAAQASIMVALGALSLSGLVIALSAGIIKRQA